MTEQEVRRYLRKMSEQDSQTAFRDFYDMTYDRLFRIAYYYTHHEEWSQEIVLDVFMKLWEHRKQLLEITNIEDYCFILVKNASLNYIEKEERRPTLSTETDQRKNLRVFFFKHTTSSVYIKRMPYLLPL